MCTFQINSYQLVKYCLIENNVIINMLEVL